MIGTGLRIIIRLELGQAGSLIGGSCNKNKEEKSRQKLRMIRTQHHSPHPRAICSVSSTDRQRSTPQLRSPQWPSQPSTTTTHCTAVATHSFRTPTRRQTAPLSCAAGNLHNRCSSPCRSAPSRPSHSRYHRGQSGTTQTKRCHLHSRCQTPTPYNHPPHQTHTSRGGTPSPPRRYSDVSASSCPCRRAPCPRSNHRCSASRRWPNRAMRSRRDPRRAPVPSATRCRGSTHRPQR